MASKMKLGVTSVVNVLGQELAKKIHNNKNNNINNTMECRKKVMKKHIQGNHSIPHPRVSGAKRSAPTVLLSHLPVCPCNTSRVNKPLALIFIYFVTVSVSSDEDINIHLSLDHGQTMRISPRDNLMAVDQANLKLTDLNNL